MSQQSAIEWTDATWSPVRGCTKVSPGCANCYAETFAERFRDVKGHPYEQGFDLRLVPEKLKEPLGWKKPRRVFVNSMSDLFQNDVPFAYIDRVFAVMAFAGQHTFQVLTKRPERMLAYVSHLAKSIKPIETAARDMGLTFNFNGISLLPWPIPNVWLGVSVENQHFVDERIPLLLQTPAAVRFISAEPLLGPVRLYGRGIPYEQELMAGPMTNGGPKYLGGPFLDWVIVGGESGPGARPLDIGWARSMVRQCQLAGLPVFVKQLGARPFTPNAAIAAPLNRERGRDGNYWLAMRNRKGGDPSEWPEDLQVREFPPSCDAVGQRSGDPHFSTRDQSSSPISPSPQKGKPA